MPVDDGVLWFLRTSAEELGPVLLLRVEGRVSSATVPGLAAALARPDPGHLRGVVVDLSGVDYINGAGLQAIQAAAARLAASSCELVVCGLRPVIQTAFDLAGSIPHLSIEPAPEAAVRRLLGDGPR
jgi:anti-anti-sigma factor